MRPARYQLFAAAARITGTPALASSSRDHLPSLDERSAVSTTELVKNIVVLSDGTAKDGGVGVDTNVYRLFKAAENRTSRQVVFYDRGLGTGWRRLTGSAFGAGMSGNILECYRFIFDNFEAGDRIFLFGFSRGAATVRSLSAFIHLFGVLPKSRPELIKKAYAIYKEDNPKKRNRRAAEFVRDHHTMWTRVKFVGVWDTVAALGVPAPALDSLLDRLPFLRHKFHNFRLSPSVEHAFHALSIDDRRRVFHPVLWDAGPLEDYQEVRQVWFTGMHSDVGGGTSAKGLSDITLTWMLGHAKEQGLLVYRDPEMNPNPAAAMTDSRAGKGRFYSEEVREWDTGREDRPVLHPKVLERVEHFNGTHTPYKPWIIEHQYEVGE